MKMYIEQDGFNDAINTLLNYAKRLKRLNLFILTSKEESINTGWLMLIKQLNEIHDIEIVITNIITYEYAYKHYISLLNQIDDNTLLIFDHFEKFKKPNTKCIKMIKNHFLTKKHIDSMFIKRKQLTHLDEIITHCFLTNYIENISEFYAQYTKLESIVNGIKYGNFKNRFNHNQLIGIKKDLMGKESLIYKNNQYYFNKKYITSQINDLQLHLNRSISNFNFGGIQ